MFDTRELGRRPGALKRISRSVEAPADLGVEVIGVPTGARLDVELRMESVMEGVLVTGTVHAPLAGECVRCLEPLAREVEADFQEMYAYPDLEGRGRSAEPADEERDEETLYLQGDLFDLEPVLRDAVVLALPLQPVCREDCPGLCPDCGVPLAQDPDHQHDEAVDIRWAALREFAGRTGPAEPDGKQEKAPRASGDESQEK
ncbi:YceD family protein [Streptomyces millisiae]|uniref:YceD family protein n=1 Tax=Streptomyces millisiae TaxID=3075542 RepID=A0ABU2LVK0_9ACTN|nr:YceD family protein [Streptomyces sp. DSM 44918]MDT0321207.1 YceD family protein [Streptomyces sp. DSM 44918]